jgi:TDG/mug DNA glycosylase family protein
VLLAPQQERDLLKFGLGLTNSVARPTAGSGDLRAADFEGALARLETLATRLEPRWLAFVGKDAYAPLFRPRRVVELGEQDASLGGCRVFVLPSTSPANATLREAEKVAWFERLARQVASTAGDDYLRGA